MYLCYVWVTCLYIDKQSRNIGPFKEVHVYCSLPIYQSDIKLGYFENSY